MDIAITGGTGFIGRKLAELHLAAGDRVRILSRRTGSDIPSGAHVFRGDLTDPGSTLSGFALGADVLYHCAGEIHRPERMRALHVEGTQRLLDAAQGRIGRWVQLSSVGIYGQHRAGEVTEATAPAPVGIYEITKANSDRLVEKSGIPYAILRPSIVFGENMPNPSLHHLIAAVDRRLFFFIGQPGASANYVYVQDVVHGLYLCATCQNAVGRAFNLSDYCSMEEFISFIANSLGRKQPSLRLPEALVRKLALVMGRFPGFPLSSSRIDAMTARCHYPISLVKTELGYSHQIGLRSGMKRLVSRWKEMRE